MVEFASWRSYSRFARAVRYEQRYVRSAESEKFLRNVLATAKDRVQKLKKGRLLWRAQLGHDWRPDGPEEYRIEVPCPHGPERMKPLQDRAIEGRTNAKGISHLYLANEKETALSEVRPWIGSYISVAQFVTLQDLKLVNFAINKNRNHFYFEEPSPEARQEAVWAEIDAAFSEPTTRSDDTADYAPTQIISELFKTKGFDGLFYNSHFGQSGINIVLFNPSTAEILNCELNKVKNMKFKFESEDQYFLNKDVNKSIIKEN